MIYNESPRRKQITQQVSWGHWFAFANILMATAISSIYLFSSPIADTPISFVYLITTWLGHTSFITFLGFVILILPLCYKVTNTRLLKAMASIIAAVCLALLAFDALLYNKTGFHITLSSAELLKSEAQGSIGAFGWLQWFYFALLFIIWLMFQLVIANAIFKRIGRFQRVKYARYIIVTIVVCFASSHAIHVWADARLYSPVLKQDNMFPLSYPATAKTLMARYGLLNLEERTQQEELQYSSEASRFNYPPKPVYCSVDEHKKIVVIATLDIPTNQVLDGFQKNQYHLNLLTDNQQLSTQLWYGIPANLIKMTNSPAVASELLQAFDVDVQSYVSSNDDTIGSPTTPNVGSEETLEAETETQVQEIEEAPLFTAFKQSMNESISGFYMGVVNKREFSSIDFSNLQTNASVMIIHNTEQQNFLLQSNFIKSMPVSSNEDIIPTVLNAFGCLAEPNRFSTGQALQKPSRKWLVSTQNNNLVVVQYPYMTKIAKDGSYEVTDLNTQSKVLADLDTNLLSRSIKHLKDFSDK